MEESFFSRMPLFGSSTKFNPVYISEVMPKLSIASAHSEKGVADNLFRARKKYCIASWCSPSQDRSPCNQNCNGTRVVLG